MPNSAPIKPRKNKSKGIFSKIRENGAENGEETNAYQREKERKKRMRGAGSWEGKGSKDNPRLCLHEAAFFYFAQVFYMLLFFILFLFSFLFFSFFFFLHV